MAGAPRFHLTSREGDVALAEGEHVIGRTAQCDVQIQSDQVSRRHARLTVTAEFFHIEDLGSLNGTFVNGAKIAAKQILLPGDRVRIGDRDFLVRGTLSPAEHEIRTPITSGYAKLPDLHLPSVIVSQIEDDEPTLPTPDGPSAAAVLVGLGDPALAEALILTAIARGTHVPFRAVALDDLYGELGNAGPGGLVLDVEALGPTLPDLVRAWRGPGRRKDPIVLVGNLDEGDGADLAAKSGADAFVAATRPYPEVVAEVLEALVEAGI